MGKEIRRVRYAIRKLEAQLQYQTKFLSYAETLSLYKTIRDDLNTRISDLETEIRMNDEYEARLLSATETLTEASS